MLVSNSVIAYLLLTGRAGDRLLGETAVQFEVWRKFAEGPSDRLVDVLITPMETLPAAELSLDLYKSLTANSEKERRSPHYGIVPLEGFIAIRLNMAEFARVVLPAAGIDLRRLTDDLVDLARSTDPEPREPQDRDLLTVRDLARLALEYLHRLSPLHRTMLLVLLLLARPPGGEREVFDGCCQTYAT